jgi:hypothetical protein
MITSRRCDRHYGLRNGTTSRAYYAGQLPGRRTARSISVSRRAAERLFGGAIVEIARSSARQC